MILIVREESRKAVLAVLFVNNEQINRGTQEEKQRKGGKERLCVCIPEVYVRVKEGQRRMERKKIRLL